MFIYKTSHFSIYFGDAEQSIIVDEIVQQKNVSSQISYAAQRLQASHVAFLRQSHGVVGLQIHKQDQVSYFFESDGDYLFTQNIHYGIGVVTADCLPIVLYDQVTHTAAIIHAGWKGLVSGILQETVAKLVQTIGIIPSNLLVFCGPSARPCCYEVQPDFMNMFTDYVQDIDMFFIQKNNKIYFDSTSFMIVLARNLGIMYENIYTRYNVCTICTVQFCSYRREKEKARRQISMVCLH